MKQDILQAIAAIQASLTRVISVLSLAHAVRFPEKFAEKVKNIQKLRFHSIYRGAVSRHLCKNKYWNSRTLCDNWFCIS